MIYFRLALATLFVALIALALWYRGQAIGAEAEARRVRADLDTALAANAAQQRAIERMAAAAEVTNRIMLGVADQIAGINAALVATNEEIGDLKDANEDVRAFLGAPVPPDLERLLNR